jgi:uncharacterized membrane protein YjgN (DUF898 family)
MTHDETAVLPLPLQLAHADPVQGAHAAADKVAPADCAHTYALVFTGNGAEYFRLWVVNVFLTLVTLGIYSAWAKVRKTRYFWQNTRLAGHVFDYHGKPAAILRGRIVAVVLLAAYSWATHFSKMAGIATIAVLCAAGPWLFLKAQQFKLRNTSHRGLRFDFDGASIGVYAMLLPPLLIWFSGSMAGLVYGDKPWVQLLLALATFAVLPWMHHRLKRYQHDRVCFGRLRSAFAPATPGFYAIYLRALGLSIGVCVPVALVAAAVVMAGTVLVEHDLVLQTQVGWTVGLCVTLLFWVGLSPYFGSRIQRLVWDHTRLGALQFHTTMTAGGLLRVIAPSVAWTVLTLGFYWPFAAIRLARYRVQCMEVRSAQPLDAIACGTAPAATAAAGDGAADFFGLDVGL